MQDKIVKKLFQEQCDYYSAQVQSSGYSPLVSLFKKWNKKNKVKTNCKVCEFGGAAGQLLNAIKKQYPHVSLTNIELVGDYRKKQVSKSIRFIEDSILNSNIKDRSYDVLIIRDVLHHLIGRDLTETENNQKKALNNLKRILKRDGIILIEEIVNPSNWACKMIYYLSKLNSRIGLKLLNFEISSNTVIKLLTPNQLHNLVVNTFSEQQIKYEKHYYFKANYKERLVHLGFSYQKVCFLIQS